MRKVFSVFTVAVCFLSVNVAAAAESTSSAKTSAAIGYMNVIQGTGALAAQTEDAWKTIMSTQLKTANQSDLFIDVSLQSAVYTQTEVKSKGGAKDTSSAQAGVRVRVLIDGEPALPGAGGVIFNDRYQELSAELQGQLEWADQDGDGQIDEIAIADYESIELVLRTISANAFNFVQPNVASGVHTVEVQALVTSTSDSQSGSASATAVIGAGSMRVDEVRMTTDDTAQGM